MHMPRRKDLCACLSLEIFTLGKTGFRNRSLVRKSLASVLNCLVMMANPQACPAISVRIGMLETTQPIGQDLMGRGGRSIVFYVCHLRLKYLCLWRSITKNTAKVWCLCGVCVVFVCCIWTALFGYNRRLTKATDTTIHN